MKLKMFEKKILQIYKEINYVSSRTNLKEPSTVFTSKA